jgi:hypothetical protein
VGRDKVFPPPKELGLWILDARIEERVCGLSDFCVSIPYLPSFTINRMKWGCWEEIIVEGVYHVMPEMFS